MKNVAHRNIRSAFIDTQSVNKGPIGWSGGHVVPQRNINILVHPAQVGVTHSSAFFLHTLVVAPTALNEPHNLFSQEVFHAAALDTVDSCLRGFSGTILAYGQTNSGKTWTVTGGESFEDRGLAPRAIGYLFREIRNAETRGLSMRYAVGGVGTWVRCG